MSGTALPLITAERLDPPAQERLGSARNGGRHTGDRVLDSDDAIAGPVAPAPGVHNDAGLPIRAVRHRESISLLTGGQPHARIASREEGVR
jgi:hypothetical protein